MVHRRQVQQLTFLATFAWRSYATQTMGRPVTKVPIPGVDHIIAVASGKGGVGKSTTAGWSCQSMHTVHELVACRADQTVSWSRLLFLQST